MLLILTSPLLLEARGWPPYSVSQAEFGGLLLPVGRVAASMFDFMSCTALLTPAEISTALASAAFKQWDGVLDNHGRAVARGVRGLTWSLHPGKGRLRISGSVPTFANGHNVQLLPFPEAVLATAELAAMVGLPAGRLVVKGLELSADIDLPTSPRPFLESLKHHRQSKFCAVKPPKGIARPMEYVATHANYLIKPYDKGAYLAYQGNPLPPGQHKLRYEVVCTRARPINTLLNKTQVTLADLATPSFYLAAAAELRKHWRLTVRQTPPNFTGLKLKDSSLLHCGASPEYWRGLKEAKTPAITIKRQKAHYKELAAAAQERAGIDIYNQRFPLVLAAALATVPAAENDTILHSCNQMEFTPIKEREEALAPYPAEGLLYHPATASLGKTEETSAKTPADTAPRSCLTCGRAIATHNPKAKYCTAGEVGESAAKKCRNAASNPPNNARRRLLEIEGRLRQDEKEGLLFDIRPFVQVPQQLRELSLAA